MEWLKLNKEEAEKRYNVFCHNGEISCDPSYTELRSELLDLFQTVLNELEINPDEKALKNNEAYLLDLSFGLKIYDLFGSKYDMDVRDAANANIWRYISVCVVPDLVAFRYGKEHKDRFWAKDKRIWLSSIWWYIHLSWQGDDKKTYKVLQSNSTDEILQLVDRCGRGGYRVELYRNLMYFYSTLDVKERKAKQIFRKLMVLNTAKVQVIEPEFLPGGSASYVQMLYDYIA